MALEDCSIIVLEYSDTVAMPIFEFAFIDISGDIVIDSVPVEFGIVHISHIFIPTRKYVLTLSLLFIILFNS